MLAHVAVFPREWSYAMTQQVAEDPETCLALSNAGQLKGCPPQQSVCQLWHALPLGRPASAMSGWSDWRRCRKQIPPYFCLVRIPRRSTVVASCRPQILQLRSCNSANHAFHRVFILKARGQNGGAAHGCRKGGLAPQSTHKHIGLS